MIKIIVAGSRNYNNYPKLKNTLNNIIGKISRSDIEIVSGTATGADRLGEKYAKEHDLKCTRFPADWSKYGNKAGIVRNIKMLNYIGNSGILVLFWDEESKGSKHMLEIATEFGIIVYEVIYKRKSRLNKE